MLGGVFDLFNLLIYAQNNSFWRKVGGWTINTMLKGEFAQKLSSPNIYSPSCLSKSCMIETEHRIWKILTTLIYVVLKRKAW